MIRTGQAEKISIKYRFFGVAFFIYERRVHSKTSKRYLCLLWLPPVVVDTSIIANLESDLQIFDSPWKIVGAMLFLCSPTYDDAIEITTHHIKKLWNPITYRLITVIWFFINRCDRLDPISCYGSNYYWLLHSAIIRVPTTWRPSKWMPYLP